MEIFTLRARACERRITLGIANHANKRRRRRRRRGEREANPSSRCFSTDPDASRSSPRFVTLQRARSILRSKRREERRGAEQRGVKAYITLGEDIYDYMLFS